MWLFWSQVTFGSALVSKTKLESSYYFSPQFIFTITVKIIAVLAKVNSWVQHNQYINNIHHLHGIKPLPQSIFLRLHLRRKIENLYGKGSRKSGGVLTDWVHVNNSSSGAVSFLLVLEPNTPEKGGDNRAAHGASSEPSQWCFLGCRNLTCLSQLGNEGREQWSEVIGEVHGISGQDSSVFQARERSKSFAHGLETFLPF